MSSSSRRFHLGSGFALLNARGLPRLLDGRFATLLVRISNQSFNFKSQIFYFIELSKLLYTGRKKNG